MSIVVVVLIVGMSRLAARHIQTDMNSCGFVAEWFRQSPYCSDIVAGSSPGRGVLMRSPQMVETVVHTDIFIITCSCGGGLNWHHQSIVMFHG